MKTKIFSLIVIATFLQLSPSTAQAEDDYNNFMSVHEAHEKETKITGMSFMVGGGLGLVTSVALGISSTQTLPMVGYNLTQLLSTTSIAYGAGLYYVGDSFSLEAERLKSIAGRIKSNPLLTPLEKQKLLDDETEASVGRWQNQSLKKHRIRGYLRLASAGTTTATLLLSGSSSTAGTMTSLFLIVMATAGGVADLFYKPSPREYDGVILGIGLNENLGGEVKLTYRW